MLALQTDVARLSHSSLVLGGALILRGSEVLVEAVVDDGESAVLLITLG